MQNDLPMSQYLQEDANTIHERMLGKAPADISIIEGDFFWDATRPTAEELAHLIQMELRNIIKLPFSKYSYGEYLDLIGESEGVFRKHAVKASGVIKIIGKPGTIIEKGKAVGTLSTDEKESIEFEFIETKLIEDSGIVYIKVECSKPGAIGNVSKGNIDILITPINGVETVTNEESFISGTDVESDDDYRQRILEKKQAPITSGNKYHYKQWALEVTGVGDAKIFPTWNGPGTVKVVLVNANKQGASQELIESVSSHIEDNRPIGAKVTVASATEKPIYVTSRVILAVGFNIREIQEEFNKLLDQYLKEVAFKLSYISIAKVGNILLNTPGVLDYVDLKLNNFTSNVGLEDEEIPVLGTVELGV